MAQGIPVVRLQWSGDPASFYCPVCGHPYWAMDVGKEEPCPHILFSFIAEVPEVSFHLAGLEGKVIAWIKNDAVARGYEWDDEIDDIYSYMDDELDYGIEEKVDLLASLVESSSSVCFELTSFGFSCGPQASTAVVGVDWAVPVPGK